MLGKFRFQWAMLLGPEDPLGVLLPPLQACRSSKGPQPAAQLAF